MSKIRPSTQLAQDGATTGEVLTWDGTAWTPQATAGGITQIAQTILSASATSIVFSSIPGTYTNLLLAWQARGDNASLLSNTYVRLNGDTAANYSWQRLRGNATTASAAEAIAQTAWEVGFACGSTATAGHAGVGDVIIPNYAGSTFKKGIVGRSHSPQGTTTGNYDVWFHGGTWENTAAVTSVTLTCSGNFVAGSTFTLYGMS